MIKDFVFRLIAVGLFGVSVYLIAICGWDWLAGEGTEQSLVAGASTFWGYETITSNLVWIIAGALAVCILVFCYYVWDKSR